MFSIDLLDLTFQTTSRLVQPFSHSSRQRVPILTMCHALNWQCMGDNWQLYFRICSDAPAESVASLWFTWRISGSLNCILCGIFTIFHPTGRIKYLPLLLNSQRHSDLWLFSINNVLTYSSIEIYYAAKCYFSGLTRSKLLSSFTFTAS